MHATLPLLSLPHRAFPAELALLNLARGEGCAPELDL